MKKFRKMIASILCISMILSMNIWAYADGEASTDTPTETAAEFDADTGSNTPDNTTNDGDNTYTDDNSEGDGVDDSTELSGDSDGNQSGDGTNEGGDNTGGEKGNDRQDDNTTPDGTPPTDDGTQDGDQGDDDQTGSTGNPDDNNPTGGNENTNTNENTGSDTDKPDQPDQPGSGTDPEVTPGQDGNGENTIPGIDTKPSEEPKEPETSTEGTATTTPTDTLCTCGGTNGSHFTGCDQYITPDVAPECTCDTESGTHSSDCPLYAEPDCTCEAADGAIHAESCPLYEAPTCNCGTEGDNHAETCPLYVEPAPVCDCGTETLFHTETCAVYVAPVDATVYTEADGTYTEVTDYSADSPIDVAKHDGQTIYVLQSDAPQNIYFSHGTWFGIAGVDFSVDNTEYAMLATSGALIGSGKALVTLAANTPADTKITLTADMGLLGKQSVTVKVIDELSEPMPEEPCPTVSVAGEGLPEDLSVVITDETEDEEKKTVIDAINADILEAYDLIPEMEIDFYRSFNIKLYSEGEEWQPEGKRVTVTLSDIDADLTYSKIVINHLLDTEAAVKNALANGTAIAYQAEGLNAVYPAETTASRIDDTIYYVQLYNDDDEGRYDIVVNDDNSISFELDSFSTVQVTATSYDNDLGIPDIDSDSTLKLDKTATENSDGSYTLTLEAYSTGATYAKDTEVIFVLDHSGSMYSAVDNNYWNCTNFLKAADKQAGVYAGYYFAVRKDNEGKTGYAGALVRYNETKRVWQRSKEIDISQSNYTNCKGGFVILDSKTTENNWYNISNEGAYGDSASTKFYKTISGAMIDALEAFADKIEGLDNCKVAVVGFSSVPSKGIREDDEKKYGGTGVYVNGSLVTYTKCTKDTYKNAFMEVDNESDFNLLKATIKNVYTDYHGTTTNAGFILANNIFAESNAIRAQSGEGDVNRIVVLFTDGEPTAYVTDTSTGAATNTDAGDTKSKDPAIQAAYYTKNIYGADVYAYGPSKGDEVSETFLKYISSNHPKATSLSSPGDAAESQVYAGLANNDKDLENTFAKIGELVASSTTTLGKETVLKDVISASFMLPENANKDDIEVYTAKYDGENFSDKWEPLDDAEITILDSGKEIQVKGYDFSKEWTSPVPKDAAGHDYGTKLIVQIPIVPNPDFLGGNRVPTNEETSGIYSGGVIVGDGFPVPTVDINVDESTPAFKTGQIYLSQQAEIPYILNIGKFKVDGKEYSVDGVNNEYVDIVYTISDTNYNVMTYTIPAGTKIDKLDPKNWTVKEGEPIPVSAVLTDDASYKLTCEVISTNDPRNSSNKTATETIEVYKPEITFQDSVIDLGQAADYEKNNYVNVVWKHRDTKANTNVMGNAPELQYFYDVEASAFTKETPVQITSIISPAQLDHEVPDDMELLPYVTFYRDTCNFVTCTHENLATVEHLNDDSYINFIVHINTFNLIISKTGAKDIDENQSFIFRITNPNDFTMDVIIEGNGSAKIVSLPVTAGDYTVTELSDWSWRYEPTKDTVDIDLKSVSRDQEGNVLVSFANNRDTADKWIDGNTWCQNIFGTPHWVIENGSAPSSQNKENPYTKGRTIQVTAILREEDDPAMIAIA